MNAFFKKSISFVLVLIISLGIFTPAGAIGVNGAVPVEIGYSLSADKLHRGETVELKFFFKNFAEANIDCSAFELDMYVDPAIFTAESMQCTLDRTGAMMSTTKFNSGDNKVKTIYFNPAQGLPKSSTDICTIQLKLNKNFEKETDVQLNITLAMVLDIDNTHYDVTYSSPIIKCLPSSDSPDEPVVTPSETPSASGGIIETISPVESDPPVTTPGSDNEAEAPESVEYTVKYLNPNGSIIATEKVREGASAKNSVVPYRPGYDFVGWRSTAGSLKNVTSDMSVIAVYQVSDTLYTIDVTGGMLNGENSCVRVRYDDCVVVTLDEKSVPEGMYFAGWKKSGSDKVVSYNKTYSFLVTGSTAVSAVYSDTEVKCVPQTVMTENSTTADGVIFTSENYLPEGYSYSGSGIIVTKDAVVGTSVKSFILNGENTTAYRAEKNSLNSQFSLISYKLEDVFYARAYLIYKNDAGEKITVYSDIDMYDPAIF